MEVTLAYNITTATNGPSVGVQPYGGTEPIVVDVYGQGVGTSGAQNIVFDVEHSVDGTTWTTAATITVAGTHTSKPFTYQVKVAKPYVRANVTTITGTGAALYANMRVA
jgi:hypothetical protein